jgi:uncharacterized membrane protein YeaQ/YmgE (transglycosylase-associated protein family)
MTTTSNSLSSASPVSQLRAVLAVDAASGLAMGAAFAAASGPLSTLLGLPRGLLLELGLVLLPFGLFIAWLASRPVPPAGLVKLLIVGNGAWVAASVVLLLTPFVSPTPVGTGFVLAQAGALLVLAILEAVLLRKVMAA